MNEDSIRKYARLMKELELTGLEVKEDNQTVRLERAMTGAAPAAVTILPQEQPEAADPAENTVPVTSPMVGVFYAAPAENAETFVKAGDRVRAGDTLCIIESMKLMNEITAERDGTVRTVCAVNGQVVEYGTVLFELEAEA
jgi:acetyl-CoA carboxylase biotin carboxyl carrier protein